MGTNFELAAEALPLSELSSLFKDIPFIKTSKKIQYANVPAVFDIEVSSFLDEYGAKCAIMYAFVFGVNGKAVIGRSWEEAMLCFTKACEDLDLGEKRRLVIYVHNLAYEFQFIRFRLPWLKVFATDERKPLYALTVTGLEFRCSNRLSGYSLEKVGEHLTKYPVKKMVGDLDYSLLRHPETPLTPKELGYVLNDGLVVMAYIQEEIERCGRIDRIPLTKTGYVRKHCRDACLYDGSHKHNVRKFYAYRNLMKHMILSPLEYRELKRAFQGGFTHASSLWSRRRANDVASYDFTSSYPAVMLSEKFPMGTGERIHIKDREEFDFNLKAYCCLFDIAFDGLVSRFPYEHYISSSKCVNMVNQKVDNGRIYCADHLETTITDIDFQIIRKTYAWKSMRVKNFIRYRRGYLPHDFVKAILDLYQTKTELKGVAGKEVEYMNSKEMLNSCYGMTVTDPCRPEISFDGGQWSLEEGDEEEQLQRYNDSKRRFLFYPWGIWTTAYARRNVWMGILECKGDYIYSDTDSIKIVHRENHEAFISWYNNMITEKLEKAMAYHKIPLERIRPKTKDGVEKPLGVWDYEGTYDSFRTLGAKRYMTMLGEDLSITVSGVNKKFAVPYLWHEFKNADAIFDHFDEDLIFPGVYLKDGNEESATGKNVHCYIDDPREGDMVDYLGNPYHYFEWSAIHMSPASYELSLSTAYIEYLLGIKDSEY